MHEDQFVDADVRRAAIGRGPSRSAVQALEDTDVGDRVLMLYMGRFVVDGTPEEVLQAQEPHVRRFVRGVAEPGDVLTYTTPGARRSRPGRFRAPSSLACKSRHVSGWASS